MQESCVNENDLRDCFAMFALNGLISAADGRFDMEAVAISAYKQADAMLEARKPKAEEGIVAIKKRVRKT